MYCQKCGEKIEKGAAFCPNCGTKCKEEKQEFTTKEKENVSQNSIKSKLFTVCMILGIICVFLGAFGMLGIMAVKDSASRYSEIEASMGSGDYWDYLHTYGCDLAARSCYCEKADSVSECVDEYLNNPPKRYAKDGYVFIKNRYLFFTIAICCFVASWILHEKKQKIDKKILVVGGVIVAFILLVVVVVILRKL